MSERDPTDVSGPASGGDSVWDFSEDARPGLNQDDGAATPEEIAPNVIAPDLDGDVLPPGIGHPGLF
jgi:hypothetical protein